jgi:hypothetical protein
MAPFTRSDLEMFARLRIDLSLLEEGGIERLTDMEARQYGFTASVDESLDGVVFPYYSLATGQRVTARLRRDNPLVKDGKEKKYVTPYGDRRDLYFPPNAGEKLGDLTTMVPLVESEKATLALVCWARRAERNILPVGLGGCWGWRCRFKRQTPDGRQIEEQGVLPSLATCTRDREVVLMLDSNVSTNLKVRAAQRALVSTLVSYGARVRIASLPASDGVNGPDDLLAIAGDMAMAAVFDSARPATDVAYEDAERAIQATYEADESAKAAEVIYACGLIAEVEGKIERESLVARLAKAAYRLIYKASIAEMVEAQIATHEQERIERGRILKKTLTPKVDARQLVLDLYRYFYERLYVPREAALVLTYFTINTWTYELADTCPYLLVESAVMRCGKTTTIRLLDAVCCRSRSTAALTEATAFRIVDSERGTLMTDEAETLESKSERAQSIRAIYQVGYQKGSLVPRCEGEEHEIRWYDAYCPKVYSVIGGLTGALLDRCLVLHMERAPKNHTRKPSRIRAIRKAAASLVPRLEAYAEQNGENLRRLYEEEPDAGYWSSITDRESELWGPLLLHAKLIGKQAEMKLLRVATRFGKQKAEIQSIDWKTAQTVDLYRAIQQHRSPSFTPGELVETLLKSEAWAYLFSKIKAHDDESRRTSRAAKVGYFLKSFRLPNTKNGNGCKSYETKLVLEKLERYLPEQEAQKPLTDQPPETPPSEQAVEISISCDGATEITEGTESFSPSSTDLVIDSSEDGSDGFVEVEI